MFCHGTPQGLQLDDSAHAGLIDAGPRRWRCSARIWGHIRRRGRRVVDVVDDVRVVLDELGVSEFRALGWSGGGPHSLAVAANVDGCVGVTVIAGIAPFDFDGWCDGMGEANVR